MDGADAYEAADGAEPLVFTCDGHTLSVRRPDGTPAQIAAVAVKRSEALQDVGRRGPGEHALDITWQLFEGWIQSLDRRPSTWRQAAAAWQVRRCRVAPARARRCQAPRARFAQHALYQILLLLQVSPRLCASMCAALGRACARVPRARRGQRGRHRRSRTPCVTSKVPSSP